MQNQTLQNTTSAINNTISKGIKTKENFAKHAIDVLHGELGMIFGSDDSATTRQNVSLQNSTDLTSPSPLNKTTIVNPEVITSATTNATKVLSDNSSRAHDVGTTLSQITTGQPSTSTTIPTTTIQETTTRAAASALSTSFLGSLHNNINNNKLLWCVLLCLSTLFCILTRWYVYRNEKRTPVNNAVRKPWSALDSISDFASFSNIIFLIELILLIPFLDEATTFTISATIILLVLYGVSTIVSLVCSILIVNPAIHILNKC